MIQCIMRIGRKYSCRKRGQEEQLETYRTSGGGGKRKAGGRRWLDKDRDAALLFHAAHWLQQKMQEGELKGCEHTASGRCSLSWLSNQKCL